MSPDPYVLEQLPKEICVYYISKNSNGRISLNVDALPVILPTPYKYLNDKIQIPFPRQQKILRSIDGSVIAFETGGIDPESLEGFSVQAIGLAEIVRPTLKDDSSDSRCYLTIAPSIIKGSLIHAHRR